MRADGAPDVAAARGAAQEAGDAASPSPGASPAPDLDEDGPPPGDAEEHARAAGLVKVPASNRRYGGTTIQQVHESGAEGVEWLRWALHDERPWMKTGDVFAQALHVYATRYLPELLGEREAA